MNNMSFLTSRAADPRMVGGSTMQFEFHVDVSTIVTAVVLLILVALSACTVLGTGHNTLVLAKEPPRPGVYEGDEFKHLIAKQGKTRFIGLQGKNPQEGWEKFEKERLGGTDADVASIDINVRDQTVTPPLDLFNVETATTTAADVTKFFADKDLTPEQKDALLIQFRDSFRSMPETYSRLVSRGVDAANNPIYYYYPQVTIDLTGTLNSAETLDRFDYIAVAIRIPDKNTTFINFSPKMANCSTSHSDSTQADRQCHRERQHEQQGHNERDNGQQFDRSIGNRRIRGWRDRLWRLCELHAHRRTHPRHKILARGALGRDHAEW